MEFDLLKQAVLVDVSQDISEKLENFNCDDRHVNKFFKVKAMDFSSQFLSRSFCFVNKENLDEIICAYCLSNDSVNLLGLPDKVKEKFQNKFPRGKGLASYPAIKIGRLGVQKEYSDGGAHIGSQLLDYIKYKCLEFGINSACRYLVVDSYNKEKNLNFYKSNGFEFLMEEDEEKRINRKAPNESLETRFMVFDLQKYYMKMQKESEEQVAP